MFDPFVGFRRLQGDLLRFEVELRCLGVFSGRHLRVDVVAGGCLHFALERNGSIGEPTIRLAQDEHVQVDSEDDSQPDECRQG